jgi:hypothetical protein
MLHQYFEHLKHIPPKQRRLPFTFYTTSFDGDLAPGISLSPTFNDIHLCNFRCVMPERQRT